MRYVDILNSHYAISETGRVLNKNTGKFMTVQRSKGRSVIGLFIDNKVKGFGVAVLVAQAFVPNPDNLPNVGFKDNNPNNCAANNLYWTDEKVNYAPEPEFKPKPEPIQHNPAKTIPEEVAAEIRSELKRGFKAKELAFMYEIPAAVIHRIGAGK